MVIVYRYDWFVLKCYAPLKGANPHKIQSNSNFNLDILQLVYFG